MDDYNKLREIYAFKKWPTDDGDLPEVDNNMEDKVKVIAVDNDGNFYHPEEVGCAPRKVVIPKMENGRYKLEVTKIENNDLVNSPSHYTRGSQAAIDTIEEAIQDAPDPVIGSAHGQVLRYLIRLWLKENPLRDAKKARWYLDRLISKLEDNQ